MSVASDLSPVSTFSKTNFQRPRFAFALSLAVEAFPSQKSKKCGFGMVIVLASFVVSLSSA